MSIVWKKTPAGFETPRAAVKAAAEFLLPKNHSALVEQLRKAAEKL